MRPTVKTDRFSTHRIHSRHGTRTPVVRQRARRWLLAGFATASLSGCVGEEFVAGPEPSTTCSGNFAEGPIEASCGTFVNPGAADGGDGSQDAPFRSIQDALATDAETIFVCEGKIGEAVTVERSVEILGGYACADWTRASSRTRIEPAPGEVALTIAGADNEVRLRSFSVVAVAPTAPSTSSVSVFVSRATVTLEDAELIAGDGSNGEDGDDGGPALMSDETLDGSNGSVGGAGGVNAECGLSGGDGGEGVLMGNDGGAGGDGDDGDGAKGGNGQMSSGTFCIVGNGVPGGGVRGDDAPIASGGTGAGTLSEDGFEPAHGDDGMAGEDGTSGGGGGGAESTLSTVVGGTGGGGGAAGCGGIGGTGGKAGGSSIALVSFMASITLSDVSLRAGSGGDGGNGGDAQSGQIGGDGGLGESSGGATACDGGGGGDGGHGAGGGGGMGGHSLGVLFRGNVPAGLGDITVEDAGDPGTGGNSDGAPGGEGTAGLAQEMLEL